MVKNAPSATIIKKLADAAVNAISIRDLLAAAGYIDLLPDDGNDEHSYLYQFEQLQQWQRVIEEAARYDISPEEALDFIRSLGKSMARIRKNES
jgi:adenylosuccinate synthase